MGKLRPLVEALKDSGHSLATHARRMVDLPGNHKHKLDDIRTKAEATDAGAAASAAKLPRRGAPNSFGYDERGKRMPYANSRPSYGKDQVKDVWEQADRDLDGNVVVYDRDGNQVVVDWKPGQPRRDKWDMGHVPGAEYRTLREQYLNHEISKEQFLAEYRNPDTYQVEHPGRNRSHVDEAK